MTLSVKQVTITDKGLAIVYTVENEVKYIDSYFENGKLVLDITKEDKSWKQIDNVINFIVLCIG